MVYHWFVQTDDKSSYSFHDGSSSHYLPLLLQFQTVDAQYSVSLSSPPLYGEGYLQRAHLLFLVMMTVPLKSRRLMSTLLGPFSTSVLVPSGTLYSTGNKTQPFRPSFHAASLGRKLIVMGFFSSFPVLIFTSFHGIRGKVSKQTFPGRLFPCLPNLLEPLWNSRISRLLPSVSRPVFLQSLPSTPLLLLTSSSRPAFFLPPIERSLAFAPILSNMRMLKSMIFSFSFQSSSLQLPHLQIWIFRST